MVRIQVTHAAARTVLGCPDAEERQVEVPLDLF